MEAPAMYNSVKLVGVNTATQEEIDALPDFLKDKIKSSEEYAKRFRQGEGTSATSNPDDNLF
jgi:hypothetical protein